MKPRSVLALLLIVALPIGAFSATSARAAKVTRSHRVVFAVSREGPESDPVRCRQSELWPLYVPARPEPRSCLL